MTSDTTESLAIRRKRLRYLSWHRGMRETDLLLGGFADRAIATLSRDQLDRYEALLANSDPDILNWIAGRSPVPSAFDNDIMALLKNIKYHRTMP